MDPTKVKITGKEFITFLIMFIPVSFAFILWQIPMLREKWINIYLVSAISIPLLVAGFYLKNKAFKIYNKDKNKNDRLLSYSSRKSNAVMFFLLVLFIGYITTLAIFDKDLFCILGLNSC